MKKTFLIVSAFIFSLTLNAEECSCGSYESGMYDYVVIDDTGGCCEGRHDTEYPTRFTTFCPGPGMTWILRDIQRIEFIDAIRACCPNA